MTSKDPFYLKWFYDSVILYPALFGSSASLITLLVESLLLLILSPYGCGCA